MKTDQFLNLLAEFLDVDRGLLATSVELKSLPEYSSMSIMSIIALVDEHFGMTISAKDLNSVVTVNDLKSLIGSEKFSD